MRRLPGSASHNFCVSLKVCSRLTGVIAAIKALSSNAAVSPLSTTAPSRITETWLASRRISGSLWEINTMPTPSACSARIWRNRRSVSPGVSDAVGSSRIRIFASRINPRRISTIC
ncbi:hypothetical protein D3C71_1530780 [compost metagenome]